MPCVQRMPLRVRWQWTWQSAEPELRSRGDSLRPRLADYEHALHAASMQHSPGAPPCRGGAWFQLLAEAAASVFSD